MKKQFVAPVLREERHLAQLTLQSAISGGCVTVECKEG
jgi:hypothetical protein